MRPKQWRPRRHVFKLKRRLRLALIINERMESIIHWTNNVMVKAIWLDRRRILGVLKHKHRKKFSSKKKHRHCILFTDESLVKGIIFLGSKIARNSVKNFSGHCTPYMKYRQYRTSTTCARFCNHSWNLALPDKANTATPQTPTDVSLC